MSKEINKIQLEDATEKVMMGQVIKKRALEWGSLSADYLPPEILGKTYGELWVNEAGELEHRGDVAESGKVFLDHLYQQNKEYQRAIKNSAALIEMLERLFETTDREYMPIWQEAAELLVEVKK